MVAVPNRLHDAAAAVVEGGGDCAGKVNAQIYGRLGEDFLRCAHEAQNVIRKHRAHQCEHRPCQKGEGQVGMDRLGELLPVAGAEIPRHRHARADEHTLHKADQHKNKRPHRAHRRQRRVAQHVAHNQCVHCAVELLEQVADEKGHRKADNLSADGPFRHPDGGDAVMNVVVMKQHRRYLRKKTSKVSERMCGANHIAPLRLCQPGFFSFALLIFSLVAMHSLPPYEDSDASSSCPGRCSHPPRLPHNFSCSTKLFHPLLLFLQFSEDIFLTDTDFFHREALQKCFLCFSSV